MAYLLDKRGSALLVLRRAATSPWPYSSIPSYRAVEAGMADLLEKRRSALEVLRMRRV